MAARFVVCLLLLQVPRPSLKIGYGGDVCYEGVLRSEAQVRKRSFSAIYIYINASFYQDRLGTNIGKAL